MKNLIVLITVATATLLSSCTKDAQTREQTTNDEFQTELLFEHDGIKVYRFTDCGRYIYYTDCRGGETMEHSGGKSDKYSEVHNIDK